MMARLKKINKQHWVCLVLCLVSAALLIFRYEFSFLRLFQAFKDTWESAKLWFAFCFEDVISKLGFSVSANPTVLDPVNIAWKDQLTFDFDLAYWKVLHYGDSLTSISNFNAFWGEFLIFLFNFSRT